MLCARFAPDERRYREVNGSVDKVAKVKYERSSTVFEVEGRRMVVHLKYCE